MSLSRGGRRVSLRARQQAVAGLRGQGDVDASEIAAFIATMAAEMVTLAEIADMKTLAYLADMVRLEAEAQVIDRPGR
ncbi:hypothetical protein E8L99_18710 [Phreatobacter aquaticus]|uniref:Uncharacterized protein n=1 Tax=Phreatobacter aquaticus TaxID=2570229 RepID=A0A4D7QP11_9HYPH|nr:hypothetical protein [Phreatobacter aquaticus]QCK87643.1 hypothetical protein E8L99_18710 [Phreatobacter aquaticus]